MSRFVHRLGACAALLTLAAAAVPSTFTAGVPMIVSASNFIPQNGTGLNYSTAGSYMGGYGCVSMALNGDGSMLFTGDPFAAPFGGVDSDGQVFVSSLSAVAAGGVPDVRQIIPLPLAFSGQGAYFGTTVAAAADGSVLLVAAPNSIMPTIFAYSLVGGSYVLASSFVGGAAVLDSNALFGFAMALAVSNPRVAIVSAISLPGSASAVYIYVRNATGAWVITTTLTSAAVNLGYSVGISANGRTAFASQPTTSSVFVYSLSAAGNVTHTSVLPGGAGFGVAMSADGATIAISTGEAGMATIFYSPTTPGGVVWAPVGQRANALDVIAPGNNARPFRFGWTGGDFFVQSLALTADGSTVIAAAPENNIGSSANAGWLAVQSKTANITNITLEGAPASFSFGSFITLNTLPQPGGATTLVVCAGEALPIPRCYIAMAAPPTVVATPPMFWVIGFCTGIGVFALLSFGLLA